MWRSLAFAVAWLAAFAMGSPKRLRAGRNHRLLQLRFGGRSKHGAVDTAHPPQRGVRGHRRQRSVQLGQRYFQQRRRYPVLPGSTPAGAKRHCELVSARQANNPNVQILLSVGGAGLSYRFSEAVRTPVGTSNLAWSCWDLAQSLGLDGIDYDWEYPGRYGQPPCPIDTCQSGNDALNFASLVTETRALMGQSPPLSVAVHNQQTGAEQVIGYNYVAMDYALTFWNVMVYELAGSWSSGTQLQAPFSMAVQTMNYWARQVGVTPNKLVLGVPFYSKYWSGIQRDRA